MIKSGNSISLGLIFIEYFNNKDIWGRMFHDISSKRPYMHAVGNHEDECDRKFENYKNRFSKGTGIGENFFYSFDYSFVHFIMLSSWAPAREFQVGSIQYNWLIHDLQNIDRKKTPWVIAVFHHLAYSSNAFYPPNMKVRNAFDPLLLKYNVDLVISGHVHAYERSCPVFNGTCGRGPVSKSFD
jgi:acid phosphatase type 7